MQCDVLPDDVPAGVWLGAAMIAVTEVTRDAETDELSATDYREIYDELRSHHTLRQFVAMIQTRYSIAWWSKYERGEIDLTREARSELRQAVGMPHLAPTIAEAVASADPNAAVYRVGEQRPDRIVLVGHDQPVTLHLNGSLTVVDVVPDMRVTAVTRRARRVSVKIDTALHERLNQARQAAGLSWSEFLTRLLE